MGSLAQSISNAIPLQRVSGLALVLDTPKGRGVFATRDIPVKTVIDVCPVIVLGVNENENHVSIHNYSITRSTAHREHILPNFVPEADVQHYNSNWPYRDKATGKVIATQAIVLGLGSMFNHSRGNQNVGWERDVDNQVVRYTTLCNVECGQELCISYGSKLTFDDTEKVNAVNEDGYELVRRIDI